MKKFRKLQASFQLLFEKILSKRFVKRFRSSKHDYSLGQFQDIFNFLSKFQHFLGILGQIYFSGVWYVDIQSLQAKTIQTDLDKQIQQYRSLELSNIEAI